ncbi:MAG: hypothetical protein JWQ16_1713 [Novosphingobium sp.]|nr:hypothetical protein [Novosphingobium sp.]
MLMSLGLFVFALPTLAYDELQRRTAWRHPTTDRVGAIAASQFLGEGEDNITLTGCLVPEAAGSFGALRTIRQMGKDGDHYPLVAGTGIVYGNFAIISLDERQSFILDNGVARKTDFAIELSRRS